MAYFRFEIVPPHSVREFPQDTPRSIVSIRTPGLCAEGQIRAVRVACILADMYSMNILHQQFPWQRFPLCMLPSDRKHELCSLVLGIVLEYLLLSYKLVGYKGNEAANIHRTIYNYIGNGLMNGRIQISNFILPEKWQSYYFQFADPRQ